MLEAVHKPAGRLRLKCTKHRVPDVRALRFTMAENGDGVLTFTADTDEFEQLVDEAIAAMDRLGIDKNTGQLKVEALMRDAGETFTRPVVRTATRTRKNAISPMPTPAAYPAAETLESAYAEEARHTGGIDQAELAEKPAMAGQVVMPSDDGIATAYLARDGNGAGMPSVAASKEAAHPAPAAHRASPMAGAMKLVQDELGAVEVIA